MAVEGAISNTATISSGVPRGSVDGPSLFLCYINDLPENISSTVRLFTDDTILYNSAKNNDKLQNDLRTLEAWEKEWDMQFHQHISFTSKRKAVKLIYQLRDTTIPKTSEIKYLGVAVDSKLTWGSHLSRVTNKANGILGFIRRI